MVARVFTLADPVLVSSASTIPLFTPTFFHSMDGPGLDLTNEAPGGQVLNSNGGSSKIYQQAGKVGEAVRSIGGCFSYVTGFQPNTRVTYSCWFKTDETDGTLNQGRGSIQSIRHTVDPFDQFVLSVLGTDNGVDNGKLEFIGLINSGASIISLKSTTNVVDGQWHHALAQCSTNQGVNGQLFELWVDGVLEDTIDSSTIFTVGQREYTVLANAGNCAGYLAGTVDEVAMWVDTDDGWHDEEQVAQLVALGNAGTSLKDYAGF
jgi:hypothetical protein